MPAASTDSTVAARSATRSADTSSTLAGADVSTTRANGREKSLACSASTTTPSAVASMSRDLSPAGTSSRPSARPPSTHGTVPDACDAASSKSTSATSATPAVRSPDARASRSFGSDTTSVASAVVATGPGTSALAASSTIAARSSMLPPAPPYSSGTATPNRPSSARRANTGCQAFGSPCSISRAAAVAPDPAAQSRTNSRAANCSEEMVLEGLAT